MKHSHANKLFKVERKRKIHCQNEKFPMKSSFSFAKIWQKEGGENGVKVSLKKFV